MRISKLFKIICFLFVVPICVSCNLSNSSFKRSPNCILSTTYVGESTNKFYEFYSISGTDTYAVGLTEKGKAKELIDDLGDIPSTYNNKDVTAIVSGGFHNSKCTSSFTIPSTVTVIDYEAFMGSKIDNITIPASVNQIGESAFYSCRQLSRVVIKNTGESSESSSACSCISTSSSSSSANTSSSSNSNASGQRLTTIPALCFFGCVNLKDLFLPETIKTVEEEAFHNCSSLRSTIAFSSIEKICYRAFQGCSSLKKVYISSTFFAKDSSNNPIGVIEDKAFDGCNDGLVFYLIGKTTDIQTWRNMAANRNWNQKSAIVDPGNPINPGANATAGRYKYYTPGENAGAKYTSDWIYTVDQNNDVEITSYIGPSEIDSAAVKFISFPDSFDGKNVKTIAKTVFDSVSAVKNSLERIYLPKYLKRIEASMFDSSYKKLNVIDDNTKCSLDSANTQTITGRIVLNGLTSLEAIGNSAFVNMTKLADVEKLYLPYSLKAVGTRAFGTSETDGKHMTGVTEFKWDYDDTKSALQVIGMEAFYELGRSDNSKLLTSGSIHQGHIKNDGTNNYELTTLIIPRTFRHFGIVSADVSRLSGLGLTAEKNDANLGINAFAGCPLLSKVIFKGSVLSGINGNSASDSSTYPTFDLVLASKTFAMNESLRTVVFEERVNKSLVFNTYGGLNQPVIGWSSGNNENDFGGDPALQTLVLPNKFTTLRIQDNAFVGNSRGVIYLSSTKTSNFKGSTTAKMSTLIGTPSSGSSNTLPADWRKIGRDLSGYNFINQNQFGIDQEMPIYESVLYEETIGTTDIKVGKGNTNLYIEEDDCAFVTNGSTDATMTKYLYDRYETFDGTAVVPANVGEDLSVTKIGPSAFSAAYCDNDYNGVTGHSDLTAIQVPDTITSIGEYALMRAYGVTSLSSYHVNNDDSHTVYTDVMPSSLTEIGKHAFAFCNIKKFLKIPNSCIFYENKNASGIEGTNITSVFTNNFSLRQITFLNSSGVESTSNTNYTTTTYSHTEGNVTTAYTSAIYSTSSVPKNKKTLLLVLNRDAGDLHSASGDLTVSQNVGTFNGRYGYGGETPTVNQYLYGAFKMCYWIESLILGTSNNNDLNQPLFSGIYNKTDNVGDIIYLDTLYDFETYDASKLESFSYTGTTDIPTSIATPPYSFAGCNNLTSITLPRIEQSGANKIPDGLLASISNPNLVFKVPQYDEDEEEYKYENCDPGVLDLTYTNYCAIGKEAFKNSNITTVIAPIIDVFTIDVDAFANCTDLEEIDFSNVTDKVILKGAFRGATIASDLFTYGNAKIAFDDEAFKGATFSDESFEFPVKTVKIGDSCFEGCSTLKTVTAAGDLANLEKVTVEGGTAQDNNKIFNEYVASPNIPPTAPSDTNPVTEDRGGYKQIGNFAFYLCNNLGSFPFNKFTNLERIGHYAFSMNNTMDDTKTKITPGTAPNWTVNINNQNVDTNQATICPSGNVNLPPSLTNIGVGAFNSSKVVNVKIQSTEMRFERGNTYTSCTLCGYNLGGHQFENCKALKMVMFTVPNCAWKTPYIPKTTNSDSSLQGQDNYFSECTALEKVCLPNTYEIQHWVDADEPTNNNYRPDSMVYNSKADVKMYLYHTLAAWSSGGICRYWRRTNTSNPDNVLFYAGKTIDVAYQDTNDNNKYKLRAAPKATGQEFWTVIGGEPVYLGTITDIDETTGTVIFSEVNASNKHYIANLTGISVQSQS